MYGWIDDHVDYWPMKLALKSSSRPTLSKVCDPDLAMQVKCQKDVPTVWSHSFFKYWIWVDVLAFYSYRFNLSLLSLSLYTISLFLDSVRLSHVCSRSRGTWSYQHWVLYGAMPGLRHISQQLERWPLTSQESVKATVSMSSSQPEDFPLSVLQEFIFWREKSFPFHSINVNMFILGLSVSGTKEWYKIIFRK